MTTGLYHDGDTYCLMEIKNFSRMIRFRQQQQAPATECFDKTDLRRDEKLKTNKMMELFSPMFIKRSSLFCVTSTPNFFFVCDAKLPMS